MGQSRFAEMYLVVNTAREQVLAFRINHLVGMRTNMLVYPRDKAIFYQYISYILPVFVYDSGGFYQDGTHDGKYSLKD
jgi:hypothetical protein